MGKNGGEKQHVKVNELIYEAIFLSHSGLFRTIASSWRKDDPGLRRAEVLL
jgi:hypothetical protein